MVRLLLRFCLVFNVLVLAIPALAQTPPTQGSVQLAQIASVLALDGAENTIIRAGTNMPTPVQINDAIYTGDAVNVGMGGKALIVMLDDSRFILDENNGLKIDDFIYDDENPQINTAHYSVLQGNFLYTSGESAKSANPDIRITIPYGIITVREPSTIWGGVIDNHNSVFVDNGDISFETKRGRIRILSSEGSVIRNLNSIPERPQQWPADLVTRAKRTVSLVRIDAARENLAAFRTQQPALLTNHKNNIRAAYAARLKEQNPRGNIKRLDNKQMLPVVTVTPAEPKKSAPEIIPAPEATNPPATTTEVNPEIESTAAPAAADEPAALPAHAATPVPMETESPPPESALSAPATPPADLIDGVQLTAPISDQKTESLKKETPPAPSFPRPAPAIQPLPDNLPADPAMRQEEIERLNLPSKSYSPL